MSYNPMYKPEYGGEPGGSAGPGPEAYPQQNPGYGWKPSGPEPSVPHSQPMNATMDPENLDAKFMSFSEESIRKGFIRKVYLILVAQLAITFSFVALFLFHRPLQEFSERNPGLVLGACLVTLVVVIAMACCESARRTFPTNFICLGIFTLAESFLVGAIASRYRSEEVLMAVGITAVLCLALSLFAVQTKYDFTACGGFLLAAMLVLLIFGIVAMFWRSHIVQTVYAGCGALLACVFLIYDTQIMMGGSHKYSISPEEYVFAALNLYMDVIRIFLYILQLIGSKK